MKPLHIFPAAFLLTLLIPLPASAKPKQTCVYMTESGATKHSSSLANVPARYRPAAKCFSEGQTQFLAAPDQIDLKGNIREEQITSPLGKISLRWPRSAEEYFGRTPLRATVEAARAVSRAIKRSSIPSDVQRLSLDWKIVFMDATVPSSQVPMNLISNCHPGWMTPPANIYVVAQRIAGGCFGQKSSHSVADNELSEVLVHEMGHAVEFYLLKGHGGGDRQRAEGFATWFEEFAARSSSLLSAGEIKSKQLSMAKEAFRRSPETFNFSGDAFDYARASKYFHEIENHYGVDSLMSVYKNMAETGIPFDQAVEETLGINRQLLDREVKKFVLGK